MRSHRRDFLKSSPAARYVGLDGREHRSGIPCPIGPGGLGGTNDRVLVVIQLVGGNDGLNTVVPHGLDGYARNRRALRLPLQDGSKRSTRRLACTRRWAGWPSCWKRDDSRWSKGLAIPTPTAPISGRWRSGSRPSVKQGRSRPAGLAGCSTGCPARWVAMPAAPHRQPHPAAGLEGETDGSADPRESRPVSPAACRHRERPTDQARGPRPGRSPRPGDGRPTPRVHETKHTRGLRFQQRLEQVAKLASGKSPYPN